jgi:hypothetical protein
VQDQSTRVLHQFQRFEDARDSPTPIEYPDQILDRETARIVGHTHIVVFEDEMRKVVATDNRHTLNLVIRWHCSVLSLCLDDNINIQTTAHVLLIICNFYIPYPDVGTTKPVICICNYFSSVSAHLSRTSLFAFWPARLAVRG